MGTFSVPPQEAKNHAVIETFRGVDLNNSPSNVDPSRSPAAPNMVRDQVGKVRKRMGYKTAATLPNKGRINGVHRTQKDVLIHAGTKLYQWDQKDTFKEVGTMADERSRSFLFNKKLYLLDGTTYQVYDGEALKPVSENAYVPTVIISRKPSGGGVVYEALNLVGKAWKESFLGDGRSTEYHLTTKDLGPEKVKGEILDGNGDWIEKKEGTDFTVDRAKGIVKWNSAPPIPLVTGQDNVRITAYKVRKGYADKVNHCTLFVTYGVGGAADRVFLSGNSGLPGQDFYSGYEDPTFFPDTNYTALSRDGSQVVGYAILNNLLATFLSGTTDGRNVIIRSGGLDQKGEALFRIVNTLLGEPPVAPFSFELSGKEPLFLTGQGVYAITAEDLTGEKYSQERSFYIKTALQAMEKPEQCCSTIYQDFYVLSTGKEFYLLDLEQRAYERDSPYSSYQYECYYWPEIAARTVWVQGGALCFGTEQGTICRFYTNTEEPVSYSDDGRAINAYWETGDLDGKLFFHVKTFTSVSCRLASGIQTGVKIFAQKRGIWSQVFDAKNRARFLSFNFINFAKFTFRTDPTPRTVAGKIKVKKVDKVRFRLQNEALNEPFGLYAFGVEWREPGNNYKR